MSGLCQNDIILLLGSGHQYTYETLGAATDVVCWWVTLVLVWCNGSISFGTVHLYCTGVTNWAIIAR